MQTGEIQLTQEQMGKLRGKELEILKNFIRVCEQLNLNYFVVQGTLIGAVRHKGFSPWDDDIDVGMLREDFEVFISEGQALMPENLFIQTHQTDPYYPHGFAKIRNSDTAFVETSCKKLPINHGIYIDIFPFDYYPDNPVKSAVFEMRKFFLRYRIRCSLYIPADQKFTGANLIRRVLKRCSKIIYPSLEEALDKQYMLYKSVGAGKKRINNGSPWGLRECMPAFWFNEITELVFEGIPVKAPKYYKAYLTHVYGDYMKLPPPEKRIPHHFVAILDFNKPYIEEYVLSHERQQRRDGE